jgi:trigger factor
MQTVETLNEGLKRTYTLTITPKDIDAKVDAEVKRVAPQVKMPGFRPGKVPVNLVRKMHGEALAADALNSAIQEGVQSLIADKQLRPAMQPSVALNDDYAPGKDAVVTVEMEVLPAVPTPAIDALKLERLTVPVADEAVDEQLQKFADQSKKWDDDGRGQGREMGDLVTVDFVGKTSDGVAFDGGTGTDMGVELGSGRLIPGFEDQLVGVKLGDEKTHQRHLPRRLWRQGTRRPGRDVRHHRQEGEGRRREQDRRGSGQEPRPREPRAAAWPDQGSDRAGA